MQLTIVSTYFPIPQDRGDPVRVLMLLNAVARIREYTLLVVRRPDTTSDQVAELRQRLPNVTVHDFPATPYRFGRLGPVGRFPEAFVGGMPPWIRTRYSRPLHDDLRQRSGLGIAVGEAAGAYLPGTGLRWHWDKANVLAASSLQDVSEAPDRIHRMRARYLAWASTRFESQVLSLAHSVSVTSDEEAARLRIHHGKAADFTLPSCVELPREHHPNPTERCLVWLGSFSYGPNLLGLQRFLAYGWEALRRVGYRLTLIGAGLTDQVRNTLASHEGLTILGYVDDLRPVLAEARAAVVPLWSGAGVKLKTLTLLAHAVPVFATRMGAEGVPETGAVRIVDSPDGLAAAILAATPATLDRMSAQAVTVIRDHCSAEQFAGRLVRMLSAAGYLDGSCRADAGDR